MSLRRSPTLTPAALAARRANALKSTGPRTERGKAWSSLNALRHGWDARNLRDKIARTGDKEAAVLFDWIFTRFFELCPMSTERSWRYHRRLAARVWCHLSGRMLRARVRKSGYKGWFVLHGTYRYGADLVCPRELTLLDYHDVGIRFCNPCPSRRKQMKFAWIPQVEYIDPPPRLPRARRVRADKRRGEESPGIAVRGLLARGRRPDPGPESTKDVVGTKLESGAKSASCPEESGMGAGGRDKGWAKLARLIPKTVRRLFAARGASGPGAESTKDVVGTELESHVKSATCPEEFGDRAGGATAGETAALRQDAGSTKDVVGTELESRAKSATCPEEFGLGDWAAAHPEDWAQLAPLIPGLAAAARLEEEICGPPEDDEIWDESEFEDEIWDHRQDLSLGAVVSVVGDEVAVSHPFNPQHASNEVTAHGEPSTHNPLRLDSGGRSGTAGRDGGPDSS